MKKFLKSLKIDIENHKRKYKELNKKKVILNITYFLVDSGSTINTPTLSLVNPSIGIY